MTTRARTPAPKTRRINHGGGHSYEVDGEKFEGVTTLLKSLPKNLGAWGAELGARYVLENRAAIGTIADDLLVKGAREAPFNTMRAAGVKGQDVHAIAHQLLGDQPVDVPDALVGHVDAYLAWHRRWQPFDEIGERSVINRRYRYCGTFDLLCRLPVLGMTLIDYKTSGQVYSEVGLQLAAYGMAETMFVPPAGEEVPMPRIDAYAVLWLRSDGWEFYPFQITQWERRAFLYAAELHRWLEHRASWKDHVNNVKLPALDRPPLGQTA